MKRATVRNAMVLQSRLSEGEAIPWLFATGHGNPFTQRWDQVITEKRFRVC
jgi:hypothetical protein